MRSIHLGLFLVVALLALGCGGGGITPGAGGPSAITDPAFVQGKVASRDGSTTDLGGVQVFDLDTGQAVTTNDTGGFALQVRSRERVRLRFDDPRNSMPHYGEPKGGKNVDVEGDRVDCGPFDAGENCWLEVEIGHDGEVLECWVERDHERREGEGGMHGGDAHGGIGSVSIDIDGECATFEVELRGLEGPDEYEILLRNEEDATFSLGTFLVDAEGVGTFTLEWCKEDPLPFGVESLDELCGVEILMVDSAETVILSGKLPCGGPQHGDKGPCPGSSMLLEPGATGEPDMMGFAGSMEFEGCAYIAVEVFFREAPTGDLTVVLISPTDTEATLGSITVGEKGFGELVLEICEGDTLPLGAETLADLDDHTLEVRGAASTVLLQGDFPVPQEDCGMPMPPKDGHGGHGEHGMPNMPWPKIPDPDNPPPSGDDE